MVEFRTFRNTDPPGLVEVWNEAFAGRGAVRLAHGGALERFAFAKPYFDPDGLIVALDGATRVGFAHAGFWPNGSETGISYAKGVVVALGVRPSHQRRGVGSELLRRAEAYLRGRGARAIFAGPMRPLDPFYFGIYGGSELPGFLGSETAAAPFLEAHGYRPWDTCLVFQRRLDEPVAVTDGRFALLRRRFDAVALADVARRSWWRECVRGAVETSEVALVERTNGRLAARASAWDMEGHSATWGLPAVGITDVEVHPDLRRQGLAKFLLCHLLRGWQDQYFGLAEVQTMERNPAAVALYRTLGFVQIDFGRTYRLDRDEAPGPA